MHQTPKTLHYFEAWVKIELSLNTGAAHVGRQIQHWSTHFTAQNETPSEDASGFKSKPTTQRPWNKLMISANTVILSKCNAYKSPTRSGTAAQSGLWRNNYKPLPCSTEGCQGALTGCECLARQTSFCAFPFHIETFCQAAHTFQAMFKASSRCRFKQTECAFEKKELNTAYFGWRELWNTQISQKFHSLFTRLYHVFIPCFN